MTKLFKNSKNALAFVLAFAVMAVSLFTGIAINADAACDKRDSTNIIYLDPNTYTDTDTSWKNEGDGSEGNPYIVSTVNQLRNVIAKFDATYKGKYFKIKDGIDIISLQSNYNLRMSYAQFNAGASDQDIDAAWNYFKSLDTVDKVKNYFENTNYKIKWWSGENFEAHFDFNGATIYGMYTTSGALFSGVGATATIENIAVANSYVEGGEHAATIVGRIFQKNEPAGTVKLENFEIANTYVQLKYNSTYSESKVNEYSTRVGVAVGMSTNKQWGFSLKNFLIYNCKAVFVNTFNGNYVTDYTGLVARADIPLDGENETSYYQVENGILLDCLPYDKYVAPDTGYSASGHLSRKENYNNVYVNNKLNPTPYWVLRNWDQLKNYAGKIDVMSDVTTLSDVTAEKTTGLDYTNTWIMTVNGPQLRALHGEFKATSNGASGHTLACEDCGLKTSTTSVPHTYDKSKKDGKCTTCGYECTHPDKEYANEDPADCVNDATYDEVCKDCGKTIRTNVTGAPAIGHDTEKVNVKPATCTKDGTAAHYKCKRIDCGKLYTDAAAKNETTLDALKINATGHTAKLDNDNKVLYEQKDGKHYKICATCSTQENVTLFDGEDCDCDEFTANNNGTHSGTCKVCKLEVTENCTLKEVEEVAATTEKEGVKAHYECEVCAALYEDAEGKTSTTLEKLAIAKLENKVDDTAKDDAAKDDTAKDDSKNDNNTNGTTTPTVNGDKNNESPKTGDSVALAVSAVVAIIAAGYVLVRKFVKA